MPSGRSSAAAPAPCSQPEHGDLDGAVREARAAAAAADATTMLLFRADAHRTLAEVLRLAGDGAGADRAAAQALRLYEAKGVAVATAGMTR